MDKVKLAWTATITALMSWLGVLAVPVLLLLGCNLTDYITGLVAAKYRVERIDSYKSFRGICKKIGMWVLIIIGAFLDVLIDYAADTLGIGIQLPFIVATFVAVWLIINEIISILENLLDIGVTMPPFLMPIAKYIKKQVEQKAAANQNGSEEEGES